MAFAVFYEIFEYLGSVKKAERKDLNDSKDKKGLKEVIAKVQLTAFRRFYQSSASDANPLLLGVCGFPSNAEPWQNHPKIGRIGTFAITSLSLLCPFQTH